MNHNGKKFDWVGCLVFAVLLFSTGVILRFYEEGGRLPGAVGLALMGVTLVAGFKMISKLTILQEKTRPGPNTKEPAGDSIPEEF